MSGNIQVVNGKSEFRILRNPDRGKSTRGDDGVFALGDLRDALLEAEVSGVSSDAVMHFKFHGAGSVSYLIFHRDENGHYETQPVLERPPSMNFVLAVGFMLVMFGVGFLLGMLIL